MAKSNAAGFQKPVKRIHAVMTKEQQVPKKKILKVMKRDKKKV